MHPTQGRRVGGLPVGRAQANDPVSQDGLRSGVSRGQDLVVGIGRQPGDEPDALLVQVEKPVIVNPGAVKERSGAKVSSWATVRSWVLPSVTRTHWGNKPLRTACSLMAPLRVRNLAQGNTPAHRSMVVASMILICGAFWGRGANSAESHSYSL